MDSLKFIFPQNYKYRAKILGILDYVTATIDLFVGIILFLILKVFVKRISIRIYIFITILVPIVLFSIFATDGESIVSYLMKIIRFTRRRGVYFYEKNNQDFTKINKRDKK